MSLLDFDQPARNLIESYFTLTRIRISKQNS